MFSNSKKGSFPSVSLPFSPLKFRFRSKISNFSLKIFRFSDETVTKGLKRGHFSLKMADLDQKYPFLTFMHRIKPQPELNFEFLPYIIRNIG